MLDNYKQSVPFFKFGTPNRAPYYYIYSLAHVNIKGLWMEFGVHDGTTLNLIAELMEISRRGQVIFYGFDSFEGLPEDWKKEGDRKNFDLKGELPKVFDICFSLEPEAISKIVASDYGFHIFQARSTMSLTRLIVMSLFL